MKDNYKAWDIKIDEFFNLQNSLAKLEFLVRFAVLAPSSHNTQPWAFIVKDNTIKVFRDHSRRLPVGDVNDRQLFLSIGCAIENILIAADYYGYNTTIDYSDVDHDAAVISFGELKNSLYEKNHLIHSILSRKTNRSKYKNVSIHQNILNKIIDLKTEGINIKIIDNKDKIQQLGEVTVLSSIESMVNEAFRHELSHHVKHNLTKSKFGMPGFTQGIPTPVSFLLPSLIKRFNMEKAAQKQNELLFKDHTPYIVIISTNNDNRINWINAGQIFQKIALIAEQEKISTSPWGAPIEIGNFYQNIQEIINDQNRPLMLFRMGYATSSAKKTPRIPHIETIK